MYEVPVSKGTTAVLQRVGRHCFDVAVQLSYSELDVNSVNQSVGRSLVSRRQNGDVAWAASNWVL